MSGPETEKVRYGRARLTVARSGPLTGDDRLGEALDAYEKGEVRPGTVAMAYLRERVVDHSASFRWRGARISELLPLVTSLSAEPAIEAETSRELADELVRLRSLERPEPAPPKPEPTPKPERPPKPAPRRVPGKYPVPTTAPEPEPVAPLEPEPPPRTGPPPPPEAKPKPGRPRPVTPQQRRRRIAALAVIGVLIAAAAIVVNHLSKVGDRYADEYRDAAGPAAQAVADSMDATYDTFDLYLSGYEPGLARDAIEQARDEINQQSARLDELPDEPVIGGGDDVDEVEAARAGAEAYLADSGRFLDEFDDFLELDPSQAEAEARRFYAGTIKLAVQAEAVEQAISSLGTGDGDPTPTDHYRPATPSGIGA